MMASESTGSRDVEQLHELGYAQELRRGMRTFSNFAVSFTIISILSGCLTLFGFAMNVGGPAVMTLGWLFVGFFVILVSLGMAEVASSYPTAGGLYYWAAKLAPESGRNPAAWSWFVGWFNLVGQVAVTAGIDFGLALFTTAFLNLAFGVTVTPTVTIAVYGVMLVLHGAAQHVRDQPGQAPQRRLGLVARRRRDRHRHRLRPPQPAHADRPRDGLLDRPSTTPGSKRARRSGLAFLGHPAVRRADRAAERPVHADRL